MRSFLARIPSGWLGRVLLLASLLCTAQGQQSALQLDGKPLDPLSQASGKVTVLVFVRTDCPVSNRYAPTLQRISRQYQDEAKLYLVFPDKRESAEAIGRYVNDYSYKLTALRDPQHALVKQARARITPEAAVFDKQGKLVYHGRIDNLYEDFTRARTVATTHELEDAIQAAVEGKATGLSESTAVGCYISDLE